MFGIQQYFVNALSACLEIDFLVKGEFSDWLSAASHLVLPSLALAFGFAPLVIRVLRSSLLDQRNESYVGVARLRGVSESRILWHHMLKNAALPALTMIGVQSSSLLGGSVVIETVFAYPGLGRLLIFSIQRHDIPMIEAGILTVAAIYALANLLADLAYAWLNPRIRYGRSVA